MIRTEFCFNIEYERNKLIINRIAKQNLEILTFKRVEFEIELKNEFAVHNIDSLNTNNKINNILRDTAKIIAGNAFSKCTSKLSDATRILIKERSKTFIYSSINLEHEEIPPIFCEEVERTIRNVKLRKARVQIP